MSNTFTPAHPPLQAPNKPGDKSKAEYDPAIEYPIEAILAHSHNKKHHETQYYVKYEGFTNECNRWVCSVDVELKEDSHLVQTYQKRLMAARQPSPSQSLCSLDDAEDSTPPSRASSYSPANAVNPLVPVENSSASASKPMPSNPNNSTTRRVESSLVVSRKKSKVELSVSGSNSGGFDEGKSNTALAGTLEERNGTLVESEAGISVEEWNQAHLIPRQIAAKPSWDTHITRICTIDNQTNRGNTDENKFRVGVLWKVGVLVYGTRTYLPAGIVRQKAKDRLIDYFFDHSQLVPKK
ncbi:hypothetical protein HDU98_007630 [Podochytrium sp. JEL0797]|nr:hypothetical protein HDU98_007630 [Podochytrium sp. JEL0797]